MTLQNGAIIGKRAFLWSDTAYFSADGLRLVSYGPKVFAGREWPWAVSMSTVGRDPLWFAEKVDEAGPTCIDDLLDCCLSALRLYCSEPGSMGRLMIAAHDQRARRGRLFLIASDEMCGQQPFTPIEGLHFVSSHSDSLAYREAASAGMNVTRMLDVIDTQRASPFATELGHTARIGGDCMQIEVNKRGVYSAFARRWGSELVAA